MKVTQISATRNAAGGVVVMGLGTDNKVYCWDTRLQRWVLEKAGG